MNPLFTNLASRDLAQLDDGDLLQLLTAKGEEQQALFRQAREVRREAGMDDVRLRGVIEISNQCQKKCDYCAMRVQNRNLERSRMTADEIMALAHDVVDTGIKTVFLQAGQDPGMDAVVDQVIPQIRAMGVTVLLNLGEKSKQTYQRWAQLGASQYILKFEVADPELYRAVIHADPQRRKDCLQWLREAGLEVGTGNIVGLPGQTLQHLLTDLRTGMEIKPNFVSSSPFIPNEDTPMETGGFGEVDYTLNTMAIWRIAIKNCLIPTVSALEKIRPGGQLQGLQAGANVITINFTPRAMQEKFRIYSDSRFIVSRMHAIGIVEEAGLRLQTPLRAAPANHEGRRSMPLPVAPSMS